MKIIETPLTNLRKKILVEIKVLQEIKVINNSFSKTKEEDKKKLWGHLESLKLYLKKTSNDIISSIDGIKITSAFPSAQPQALTKPITQPVFIQPVRKEIEFEQESPGSSLREEKEEEDEGEKKERLEESRLIEKESLKRFKRKEEDIVEKKIKKPSIYRKKANEMFGHYARKIRKKGYLKTLEKDLIKANLEYMPASYLSLIFYTTFWSIILGAVITLFFLFFNIGPTLPIITSVTGGILSRLPKVIWILFLIPIGTFISMYFYPSLEKKSEEMKINHELPFAVIHMAAISGSMIDPTKIFKIIIMTGEYPSVSKEFTKLLNQINVYGYDLIGGLRNMAFNSPSRKLSDLFNGLATAISSGGDLPDFFDKRASSLLFEHRLEKEKEARAAETFMDIYISVVIAAPMILMLLLMMLKVGGLGLGLSTGAITMTMILGVIVINIFFLAFLHLKQPKE